MGILLPEGIIEFGGRFLGVRPVGGVSNVKKDRKKKEQTTYVETSQHM